MLPDSKLIMKKTLIILSIGVLTACSPKLITLTQSDAERVSQKFAGITLAELNEGKALFEQNCNKCHELKNARKKSEENWKKIVPAVAQRANKKAGKEVIDSKTQDLILKYLVTETTAK